MKKSFVLVLIVIYLLSFGNPLSLNVSAQSGGQAKSAPQEITDSQAFLESMIEGGKPSNTGIDAKVEDLLSKMTLEEKVGQMTQLEIGMVTSGRGQSIQIDPAKLVPILHYDGTPITARFIVKAIADIVSVVTFAPTRKARS